MFTPARQGRISEEIVAQVENAIIGKQLRTGDRLPTERQLQETFQTSRSTVREALGILKYKGLVEIRRGGKGGAYVREMGVDQVSESLAFLIKHRRVSFKELAEFRISAEGTAAGLAAERAGPREIREFKEAQAQGERLLEEDPPDLEKFYRWEREMHQRLARLSRNSIIQWVMRTIHLNLDAYVDLVYWDRLAPRETVEEWREIGEAIADKEAFRVTALIRSHLIRYNRILKQGARNKGLLSSEEDDLFLS